MHTKGEHSIRYNMRVLHKKDAFDLLNNISKYVTLVQLMESLGNMNHDIIIVRYWIFDSNYEKALCLTQESLDAICYLSIGEKKVATFQ